MPRSKPLVLPAANSREAVAVVNLLRADQQATWWAGDPRGGDTFRQWSTTVEKLSAEIKLMGLDPEHILRDWHRSPFSPGDYLDQRRGQSGTKILEPALKRALAGKRKPSPRPQRRRAVS